MWLLIIIGAYLCASASGDADGGTPAFHKCCQKNQGLIKVVDLENGESFDCLDRESVESNYSISNPPLVIGEGVSVKYGNPDNPCEMKLVQLTLDETDIRLLTTSNNCYDRLLLEVINGTVNGDVSKIVALSCVRNETDQVPNTKLTLNHIRKCCPKGESYDTVYHLCKKIKEGIAADEESLLKRLNVSNSFIYEVETGLNCKQDQYAVELSDEFYSFEVDGSTLMVVKKKGAGGGRAFQGEWCVEQDHWRPGLVVRACSQDCAAYGAFCIRKCCPVGQHYKMKLCGSFINHCVPNEDEVPLDVSAYIEPLKNYGIGGIMGIKERLRCPHGKTMLNRSLERDHHELDRHGLLHSPFAINDDYCFEAIDTRHCEQGNVYVTAVVCFIQVPGTKRNYRKSFWLTSISSICLALTLIVYCSLPELWNRHGQTLICHISMMLLAFACLARVKYNSFEPNEKICTALGYGIYVGFMAAFAWLNVMCLDIWCTFRSMRTVQARCKSGAGRRRFLWYSLYAWGITIFLTLTMFLLDKYPIVKFLDAEIGTHDMCWFGSVQNSKTDWPHYIFFVIPMGLGTCTNFVLFMLTARHCARVKSEVHRLQAGSGGFRTTRRFRVDRAKYVLTGKLWVVMGAGWVSELASTLATHPQWLWAIVDLFNELQGVFIFLILVFKPKLYYLIRKRLGLEKPNTQKPGASSTRTSSTFLSRTISSDERATMRISQGNNIS